MHENHQAEQYFFAPPTLEDLAKFLQAFKRPALLCCPMLGRHLWEHQRRAVTVLDIDTRFADLPGFVQWDIHRPTPLDVKPDIIVCDPPFYSIGLDRLFKALRTLAQGDCTLPLVVSNPLRLASKVSSALAPFGLHVTDYYPKYVSVSSDVGIVLLSNLPSESWPKR